MRSYLLIFTTVLSSSIALRPSNLTPLALTAIPVACYYLHKRSIKKQEQRITREIAETLDRIHTRGAGVDQQALGKLCALLCKRSSPPRDDTPLAIALWGGVLPGLLVGGYIFKRIINWYRSKRSRIHPSRSHTHLRRSNSRRRRERQSTPHTPHRGISQAWAHRARSAPARTSRSNIIQPGDVVRLQRFQTASD